ncbi:MAG: amidohydrolase family protein, partial [Woeseiaceae bacterium]
GVNAAAALRLDPLLGRIAVGAAADLVFVDGDPLSNIEDARKIVAVVRNGRFFSVSGLIDRAQAFESVE